jgi:PTS system galactitol-specific IIA component
MSASEASLFMKDLVFVGLEAETSELAIRTMANNLIQKGFVHPSFVEAVLAREKIYPTGLPTVIPVGLPHTDVEHCIKPAISVAILKKPVILQMMGDPTQTVSTNLIFLLSVVTPANQVKLLTRLIDFFQQTEKLQSLMTKINADEVVAMLQAELETIPAEATKAAANTTTSGNSFEATVDHPAGLHARPAAKFVQMAAKFPCAIKITNLDKPKSYVNAKSIISVLTLEISKGNRINVTAEGERSEEALASLKTLLESNFGD